MFWCREGWLQCDHQSSLTENPALSSPCSDVLRPLPRLEAGPSGVSYSTAGEKGKGGDEAV